MKRQMILATVLALIIVLALATVAVAAPSGGANNNIVGIDRSTFAERMEGTVFEGVPFGVVQSAWVHAINRGTDFVLNGVTIDPGDFKNYGEGINWWKAASGFKQ